MKIKVGACSEKERRKQRKVCKNNKDIMELYYQQEQHEIKSLITCVIHLAGGVLSKM